ncbi:MAG: LysR substrate-binding domain-containing protein [bacterium]
MELRHLRYFVAVAEEENVSRAALKLHVSQPGLSRQVRDLEDELGLPLFERSAKSVRLTEAGREFLKESRVVLQRVDDAVQTARAVADGGNELHIGYAMSPTVRILPQILRAFQSAMPGARVRLHDLSTREMLDGLRSGSLQIAFMVHSRFAMARGLRLEKLVSLPLRLAVAPRHPLAARKTVKIPEIAQHRLLAFNRSEYPDYHEMLDAWFAKANEKPRIAGEHDSVASLIAAVEAGDGVALVTESMACVAGSRMDLLRLAPAPSQLVIAAVWRDGSLSSGAGEFLSCARKCAKTK